MGYIVGFLGFGLMGLAWNGSGGWLMFLVGAGLLWKGGSMISAKRRRARNAEPSELGGTARDRGFTSNPAARRGTSTVYLTGGDLIEAGSRLKEHIKEESKRKQRERIEAVFGRWLK